MHITEDLDQAGADLQKVSDKIQTGIVMTLYGFVEGDTNQTEVPTLPKAGGVRTSLIHKCFLGWLSSRRGYPRLLCSGLGDAIAIAEHYGWTTVEYSCAVILEEK